MKDAPMHRVAAGLLHRDGRVLLVHRTPHREWYPDAWDLPGGHVEPGETPRAALRRELHEELGIRAVVAGEPIAEVRGPGLHTSIWVIDDWDGEPTTVDRIEHDALAWLDLHEMAALRLADPRLRDLVRLALSQP